MLKFKQTFQESTNSIADMKELMIEKFEDYDRKFGELSHTAKICIGVSLGLSVADTIILIKILNKMK